MYQYHCPYCRQPVAAGERACRKCGQQLKWTPGDDGGQATEAQPKGGRSWLWPLIALMVVIILAGVGIYIFMRMAEKPPAAPPMENPAPARQNGPIIPDVKAPLISSITVDNISYNSVEIRWTTDEPSTSQVIWRMADTGIITTDEKQALVDQHVVELTDLKNKQRYYYKVRSVDQSHNEAISAEDSFDIGLAHGVAAVSITGDSMKTEEIQPSVFRTIISGKVVNTGEVPVRARDIEVWIKITVAGKPGSSEVKADLDPTPDILNPLYETKFRAVVPNRTDPQYTVTSKISAPQD